MDHQIIVDERAERWEERLVELKPATATQAAFELDAWIGRSFPVQIFQLAEPSARSSSRSRGARSH